jgi:hypothetical protein
MCRDHFNNNYYYKSSGLTQENGKNRRFSVCCHLLNKNKILKNPFFFIKVSSFRAVENKVTQHSLPVLDRRKKGTKIKSIQKSENKKNTGSKKGCHSSEQKKKLMKGYLTK